ncbi:hypothetical protein MN116_008752 [Schistosoma mekongi]|uniref:Uncharacterized protein n=1 Tax=Schistosoma mekongi TaxID=38744 RepID=A0AAE2D1M2_SCHME|nr:hypothetical protein MN116_008752 [Schistosoma mekongi]
MLKLYMKIFYIIFQQILFVSWIDEVISGYSEKRLLKYLFDQKRLDAHNPMERPVSIDGKPLQVFLKCFLNQIMDVDEKNQILATIMWLDLKWSDYHFQWNASDYENIRQINLPPERMWKPDILLYNSASEKFDQVFPTKVIVRNTGNIQWVPPGLFHSICDIEVNWFPFDSQNCIMKLGTWTYQGNTVDLKLQCDNQTDDDIVTDQPCHYMNDVDLSTYLAHSEWALESASIKRNVQTYGGTDQTYIDVTIYVHMQRRALYYMFNIIIPCMIMSLMALLVFTLPPEANEKIVLGVTTLLSLTMLLQLVADKLPQTSSGNPVLVLYFTCTMILCSLSLVCAVVLLNCHHHTGGIVYVPWWVKILINTWLASILRINHQLIDNDNEQMNIHNSKEQLLSNVELYHVDQLNPNDINHFPIDQSRNTSIWSNVIDVNSEFRPTVLIQHNKWKYNTTNDDDVNRNDDDNDHSSQKNTLKQKSTLQTVMQQDNFITNQHDISIDLRNKSLSSHISRIQENNNEGEDQVNTTSRLEYTCKRDLIEQQSRYLNKPIVQLSTSKRNNNPVNKRQYTMKTMPKFHLSSSSSSSSSSPSSSSLSAINESPYDRTSLSSSPDKINQMLSSNPIKSSNNNQEDNNLNDTILLKLKQISKELRYITSGMHQTDQEKKTSNEWRLACRVLDRFCLVIFTALNLFTTLGILTSAPTVIKAFTSRGAPSQPM